MNAMKKLMLMVVSLFICGASVSAQKLTEGSLGPIYGQEVINCVFDFMQTEAAGMPLDEFFEWKTAEDKKGEEFGPKFEKAQTSCQMNFMEKANEKLKDVRLAKKPGAEYTLTVKMLQIDKPGRENVCDYIFTNTATGEQIAVIRMEGKGGRFGSFTNLMNDAFKDGGEQFGEFLNKQFKQIAKEQKKK